uniref:Flagellar biosynthesis protein flhA n=1 Tax=Lygus hesperus TaxID=30085 RepID=A0A0A9Z8G2_LYGHE
MILVLSWIAVVLASSIVKRAAGVYTQDYCNKLQFNFNDIPRTLADFRACSELEPRKHPTELTHKFATCWAKFAVEKGLGEALQVLNNKEIRRILIPSEEWNGIVSRYTSATGGSEMNRTVANIQVLIIFILVLQIMVLVYLVRTASEVADSLTLDFDGSRHDGFFR